MTDARVQRSKHICCITQNAPTLLRNLGEYVDDFLNIPRDMYIH